MLEDDFRASINHGDVCAWDSSKYMIWIYLDSMRAGEGPRTGKHVAARNATLGRIGTKQRSELSRLPRLRRLRSGKFRELPRDASPTSPSLASTSFSG